MEINISFPLYIYYIYIYMSWKQCHRQHIYVIMKTMCPPGFHPQWLCGSLCTWAHDVWFLGTWAHIMLILLLWDLNTLCVVDHLGSLMTTIYICIKLLWSFTNFDQFFASENIENFPIYVYCIFHCIP